MPALTTTLDKALATTAIQEREKKYMKALEDHNSKYGSAPPAVVIPAGAPTSVTSGTSDIFGTIPLSADWGRASRSGNQFKMSNDEHIAQFESGN